MKEIRIGRNIAILRKNSHTTQEQLAQALHFSPQAVIKWEKRREFIVYGTRIVSDLIDCHWFFEIRG